MFYFQQRQHGLISYLGIGLFNSIMFSNIYTLSISGLGKYVSQGSSLVMAILGGALLPLFKVVLLIQWYPNLIHSTSIMLFIYPDFDYTAPNVALWCRRRCRPYKSLINSYK
ncbi:hypothetical protein CS542_04650 [Pedobacter sp. IW39]|nr:hypothetical protein CS542_04650 [Pedobacter sp. IW39]